MKCEICGKEILRDSQCINYKYYHNDCIENFQQENQQLKEIIKENTILVKDEYGDYQECNINPLEMKQKYDKQLDNWNKLKEWLEKELGDRINPNKDKWLTGVYDAYKETIDKMQELERESDNNEKSNN